MGASLELGAAGAGPMQDPGKQFFCVFILFICFAALHMFRSITAQLHKQHLFLLLFCAMQEVTMKKATIVAIAFFFMLWSCYSVAPRCGAILVL